MSTPVRIESAEDAALSAMLDHHAQLRGELESRVAALRDAAFTAAPERAAADAVVEFIDQHVLPHAAAEEGSIYPAAADDERVELLVDSMVLEHRELERKAQALRAADTPARALSAAEAFAAVFAVHVAKENDLLLPALQKRSDASLSTLLRDMHDRLSEPAAAGHEQAEETEKLDVRTLAHGARHEIIFRKLHALAAGGRLVIVNDHDPKPLRYQLDAAWPGMFDWTYVAAGPEIWQIEITRLR
ncbi:MAG TPA: DUF2249 domain-containing protein [Acidothermaceae bacterium]|jgi:uncharacterized protein (DUF2249 family)